MAKFKRASCAECPSTFELVPPADREYSVPREKQNKKDCIERIYECDEGHRNKVYWEKESKSKPLAAVVNNDYGMRPEPTKWGEEQGL